MPARRRDRRVRAADPHPDRVERRVHAPAPDRSAEACRGSNARARDTAAKKLGLSRRQFLAGTGGTAAAPLAMNEGFRPVFHRKAREMFWAAPGAAAGPP